MNRSRDCFVPLRLASLPQRCAQAPAQPIELAARAAPRPGGTPELSIMQSLASQLEALCWPIGQPVRAWVMRWMLLPGLTYEAGVQHYRPFNRLRDPDPQTRAAIVACLTQAVAASVPAFVIVNNKAEGSAPLPIAALARELVDALQPLLPPGIGRASAALGQTC